MTKGLAKGLGRALGTVVLAAGIAAGCGEDDPNLLEKFVAMHCADQAPCLLGEDLDVERLRTGVRAGRIAIVREQMERCLDVGDSLLDLAELGESAPCSKAFKGTLGDGAPCDIDVSCASLFCDRASYEHTEEGGYRLAACGICRPRREVGEPCSSHLWAGEGHRECRPELHCDAWPAGVCADGAPPAREVGGRKALGEACDTKTYVYCRSDLACDGNRCVRRLALGDACGEEGSADRCAVGAECRNGVCRAWAWSGGSCIEHCREGVCENGTCKVLPLDATCPLGELRPCGAHADCVFEEGRDRCVASQRTACATACGDGDACVGGFCGCFLGDP